MRAARPLVLIAIAAVLAAGCQQAPQREADVTDSEQAPAMREEAAKKAEGLGDSRSRNMAADEAPPAGAAAPKPGAPAKQKADDRSSATAGHYIIRRAETTPQVKDVRQAMAPAWDKLATAATPGA